MEFGLFWDIGKSAIFCEFGRKITQMPHFLTLEDLKMAENAILAQATHSKIISRKIDAFCRVGRFLRFGSDSVSGSRFLPKFLSVPVAILRYRFRFSDPLKNFIGSGSNFMIPMPDLIFSSSVKSAVHSILENIKVWSSPLSGGVYVWNDSSLYIKGMQGAHFVQQEVL